MWHEVAEQVEAPQVDLPQKSLIWNRQWPVITDAALKICAAVKSSCRCVSRCVCVCVRGCEATESCLILFTSETRLPLRCPRFRCCCCRCCGEPGQRKPEVALHAADIANY